MSLESAEKLVQRILRQMAVPHRVEEGSGDGPAIVADGAAVAALPAELRPYVKAEEPGRKQD